jgi:hypothetical protein
MGVEFRVFPFGENMRFNENNVTKKGGFLIERHRDAERKDVRLLTSAAC